jgi:hypothetical protein
MKKTRSTDTRTDTKHRLKIGNKCGVSEDINSEVAGLEDRSE